MSYEEIEVLPMRLFRIGKDGWCLKVIRKTSATHSTSLDIELTIKGDWATRAYWQGRAPFIVKFLTTPS